ncbi:hypothetical protein Ahy_B03g064415 [Arachis hypogaea]|uniref:Uncharacterized protein n=1 Tax=Arachis hypogaea TaxID=3818 RepID=A0A444ZZI5_ARAHY|nr:hypothetical protein Ahy_B03g064415 [Arachis hypogaea]
MPKIGHFTKTSKLETCQHPQTGVPAISSSHHDDSLIPYPSSDGVLAATSLRLSRPPCSKLRPVPHTCINSAHNLELEDEDLDPKANEIDSFDQHIDNLFAASRAQNCKGRKTTEFWNVNIIDSRKRIKSTILKSIGKSWRDTRSMLYHEYYDSTKTLEQNIEECLPGVDKEYWKWFIAYCNKPDTQVEVVAKKLKRKTMENKIAITEINWQIMESALRYLIQRHEGEVPSDIAAGMNPLKGQSEK